MPRPALAASRAIDILNFMAASPLRGWSLTELVRHLGVNQASCHALLAALTRDGYLERDPKRRTYRLGPALIAIGHGALQCHPVLAAARNRIDAIVAAFDLDCLLTARSGDHLIALAAGGPNPERGLRIGQHVPLIPPLGTPFLAWANEDEVEAWLARAEEPGTETARLRQSLAAVRQRGFAVTLRGPGQGAAGLALLDLAEEPLADTLKDRAVEAISRMGGEYLLIDEEPDRLLPVDLISAPVFDADGAVACTLSLYGSERPLPLAKVMEMGRRLGEFCRVAETSLPTREDGQGAVRPSQAAMSSGSGG
ncbi:MAG: helix-turn-helix domain-containing protein [Novosphingobium sp.]|nr:helix-turn-helix domain-containing protein [Novosphingobium sp.]